VLVHGFASSIYTWKDVLPALAQTHDVVALDLPGFGGSDIPRPLAGTIYPAVVFSVMDRLAIDRAALVGNSLGGSVAVAMAAERPERVTALVLIDSAGFNFGSGDRPPLLRLIAAPGVGPALEKVPVRRRLVAAGLAQVFHDDTLVTAERVDEYAVPMMRPGAAQAAADLLGSQGPPFPPVAARVRAPTLVIWGREDSWIPVAHAERFTSAIPGSTAVILDACGHVPQEEKPAEVSALIARFLAPAPRVD
jgi:pimeloyl-ACP methyl ester carboxylesterase